MCSLCYVGIVFRVCVSYVMPAYVILKILKYICVWCLGKSRNTILQTFDRFTVMVMCGVQRKDRKRAMDLMLIFGLSSTIDQLAMASNM